nr:ABC transporter substrate-binding protein [uncultured Roseateles sp.]
MSSPVVVGAAGRGPGRRKWLIFGACLALALALALGFHLARKRPPIPVAASERLTIAVPAAPHAALLHVAAAKRFFADEGLDVVTVPASHGRVALELLAQGQVDLAAAAELPFVVNVMSGQRLAIVASVASATSEMAVIARRDRGIRLPADLAGKKVGVTRGTSGEYFLWAFLIRHKLAPDAVTLIDASPGELDKQLAAGALDAIAAWQPTRFRAEAALGEGGITLIEPNAYTATYVLAAHADYLRLHPQAMQKLVRALLKAEAFAQAEPLQAQQLVADRLGVPAETLQPSWRDQEFRVDLLQPQLITLEDEARWAMAGGHVPQGAVPNFLPHLYLDALLAVQPTRVTVVH